MSEQTSSQFSSLKAETKPSEAERTSSSSEPPPQATRDSTITTAVVASR